MYLHLYLNFSEDFFSPQFKLNISIVTPIYRLIFVYNNMPRFKLIIIMIVITSVI